MNFIEKIIVFLQIEMVRPESFGWFHLLCLGLTIFSLILLFCLCKKYGEKQLKKVLLIYGLIALTLEVLKQISWSFNYDPVTNISYWNYQWYSSPFQLCTMPIYFSIIASFLKKGKLRDSILSFIAFFTILGSISTMIIPDSCFAEDILINIHTMFLHCGSFVISIFILMNKEIALNMKNFLRAFLVFISCVTFANILNISFYNLNIIGNETFNMFYISPYFISSLPVFDIIQQNVAYGFYLLIYIVVLGVGAMIVFLVAKLIENLKRKSK